MICSLSFLGPCVLPCCLSFSFAVMSCCFVLSWMSSVTCAHYPSVPLLPFAQGMSVLPLLILIIRVVMLLSLSLYHFTLWSVIHCTFYIDAGECHIIHYVTPCKQGHQVVYELRAPTIAPHPHWTIGVTSVNDVARHRGQDHVLKERCLLWRVWF